MFTELQIPRYDLIKYLAYIRNYRIISTKAFNIHDFIENSDYYGRRQIKITFLGRETIVDIRKTVCDKRRIPYANSLEFSSLLIGKIIGFSVRDISDDAPIIKCITKEYFSHNNCIERYKLSDVFTHLACFSSKSNLHDWNELYHKMEIEAKKISEMIIDHFSKKYSDDTLSSTTTDRLYSYLINVIARAFSSKIERAHEFLNNLLEKPMVVNIGTLIFKFDKIIYATPLKEYYEDTKKVTAILINLSIMSFNKALSLKVWQNYNENAFQLLIEPSFSYKFLTAKDRNNKESFNIKEGFLVNVRVSMSVSIVNSLLKLFMNPSSISFIMKYGFYRDFPHNLVKIISHVKANIMHSVRIPNYVIYFPVAV